MQALFSQLWTLRLVPFKCFPHDSVLIASLLHHFALRHQGSRAYKAQIRYGSFCYKTDASWPSVHFFICKILTSNVLEQKFKLLPGESAINEVDVPAKTSKKVLRVGECLAMMVLASFSTFLIPGSLPYVGMLFFIVLKIHEDHF